jgi:hypothetical protein
LSRVFSPRRLARGSQGLPDVFRIHHAAHLHKHTDEARSSPRHHNESDAPRSAHLHAETDVRSITLKRLSDHVISLMKHATDSEIANNTSTPNEKSCSAKDGNAPSHRHERSSSAVSRTNTIIIDAVDVNALCHHNHHNHNHKHHHNHEKSCSRECTSSCSSVKGRRANGKINDIVEARRREREKLLEDTRCRLNREREARLRRQAEQN